ncbi:MAG: hypothetical protein ABL982_24695 [Vicinamibacterales bacterium]
MRPDLLAAFAAFVLVDMVAAQVVQTVNTGTAIQPASCASYFDFEVNQKLTLTSLDFQANDVASTAGTVDVYVRPGGRTGKHTVAGDWILWAPLVPVTSAGPLAWTPVVIPPLTLNAEGPFGIALVTTLRQVTTGGGGGSYPSITLGESMLHCGELTMVPFVGQVLTNHAANVRLNYTIPVLPAVLSPFATAFPYGEGCYRKHGSFYEHFSPSSTHDLAGRNLVLTPNACGGYTVTDSTRPFWVSTNHPTIVSNDEGTSTWAPVPPMPLPGGGSTGTFHVHANGVVSSGTATVIGKTPSPAAWLSTPDTVWGDWHDYDATQPSGPVTIEILIEGLNTYWVFTWDGVSDFGVPNSANHFQMEFNTTNGQVHMHWGAMSGTGNDHLVGYSPGGASTDPGSTDVSLTPFSNCADGEPLTLSADGRPIVPSLFHLVVSHIPSVDPTITIIFLGNPLVPPISLESFGAPGCFLHLMPPVETLFLLIGPGPVATLPVLVPNNIFWLGARVDLQAAALVPLNPFGVVTSNGLTLYFGAQ